jgi:hypothetical protein
MTELPKSVRDQLARAQVPSASHPDADLLTAYSENSLGAAERQHVTEHVSVCAECREVLFLAQPKLEQEQVVAKPVSTRRFSWMAWASVAAVIVVVGSAVVLRQEKTPKVEPPTTVATVTKPTEVAPLEEMKTEPARAIKAPSGTRERDTVAKSKAPAPLFEVAPKIVVSDKEVATDQKSKDEFKAGGLVANESAQQNSQNIVAGKQAPSGPANTANVNVTNVYTAQNTAPAAAPMKKAQRKSELADAAVPSTAFGYSQDTAVRRELGRAHWRISKSGTIERSYLDDEWKPVLVGADVTFRVISVVGNVVWAGGNHGALYVSRNGGVDWAPVKFDSTADVVSIHFDDEVNGKIQTSDGKMWKTADGGNSWKQQ